MYFSGWGVNSPSGTAEYLCANIDSTPGVTYTSGSSGYNQIISFVLLDNLGRDSLSQMGKQQSCL
jgi:hypothetical protein